MPMDKGYKTGYSSSPSVKPKHGDMGGSFKSSMDSQKAGGYGASGRAYKSAPFARNPKQKNAKGATGGYHNTSAGGSPGIQSGAGSVKKMDY